MNTVQQQVSRFRTALTSPDTLAQLKNPVVWLVVLLIFADFLLALSKEIREPLTPESDFNIYLQSAASISNSQPLYVEGRWTSVYNYRYHPLFAEAFRLVAALPFTLARILWALISFLAYVISLFVWYQIAAELNFPVRPSLIVGLVVPIIAYPWIVPWW